MQINRGNDFAPGHEGSLFEIGEFKQSITWQM
jgi:hypothetical protein